MTPGEVAIGAPPDSAAASPDSPVLAQILDALEVDLNVAADGGLVIAGDVAHAESVNPRPRLRDHRHMHRFKVLHDALGVAAAMLGLVTIAVVTFALAIWAAAATVLP